MSSARRASVARTAPRQDPGRWRNSSWRAGSVESKDGTHLDAVRLHEPRLPRPEEDAVGAEHDRE